MANEDESYALLPQRELEQLKKEVEELKKNPLGKTEQSKNLLQAIDTLTESMNHLMEIFKTAQDELKLDDSESDIHKKLDKLSEKVDTLIDQNKKIAKGLLTVADLVKTSKKDDHGEAEPQKPPSPGPQGPPPPGPPGLGQPPLGMPGTPAPNNNPPSGPPGMEPMPFHDTHLGASGPGAPPPASPPGDIPPLPGMPGSPTGPGGEMAMPPPPAATEDKDHKKKGLFHFGK